MATTEQITPPDTFDFSHPADWPKWIRRFERFHIATALDNKSDEYQVNSLLYAMGDAADDVLAVLPLSDADKKKYATVKEAFDKHYVGKHNINFERAQFNSATGWGKYRVVHHCCAQTCRKLCIWSTQRRTHKGQNCACPSSCKWTQS